MATQTSSLYACAPRKKVEQAGRGRGYMFGFHYVRMRPAQKGWSRPAEWAEIIGGGRGHANFVTRDWL